MPDPLRRITRSVRAISPRNNHAIIMIAEPAVFVEGGPELSAFPHVIQHRGREDTDPGVCKKTRIAYEHSVRHRVQHESMGSIVCTYLVQYPIRVGTVLL